MTPIQSLFGGIYKGKRVLVTGHTGFKGAWLSHWLSKMGAQVSGFALPPDTKPNLFEFACNDIDSVFGDIRNYNEIRNFINHVKPEIVFHLAAQPLVIRSIEQPIESYEINAMGAVHLFESLRDQTQLNAIVCITTDKVYRETEAKKHHKEGDELGGSDPYSASKACVELISRQYRLVFENRGILLGVARAGNVLGGGDWAENRLLPDLIRGHLKNSIVRVRNPKAIRPWQHVLDCLSGYLLLGYHLLKKEKWAASEWNFGPDLDALVSVHEIVEITKGFLPNLQTTEEVEKRFNENHFLALDSTKARMELLWKPVYSSKQSVIEALKWYKSYEQFGSRACSITLDEYCLKATELGLSWAHYVP